MSISNPASARAAAAASPPRPAPTTVTAGIYSRLIRHRDASPMPATAAARHLNDHPETDHHKQYDREVRKGEFHRAYNQYLPLRSLRASKKCRIAYRFALVARAFP